MFDTYEGSDEIHKFIDEGVPDGSVVMAACKDDCSKKMSYKTKGWF